MVKSFPFEGIHYHLELVKCGRKSCRKCPHGPYWYAYSRRGAFLKKMYVGKVLNDSVQEYYLTLRLGDGRCSG